MLPVLQIVFLLLAAFVLPLTPPYFVEACPILLTSNSLSDGCLINATSQSFGTDIFLQQHAIDFFQPLALPSTAASSALLNITLGCNLIAGLPFPSSATNQFLPEYVQSDLSLAVTTHCQ